LATELAGTSATVLTGDQRHIHCLSRFVFAIRVLDDQDGSSDRFKHVANRGKAVTQGMTESTLPSTSSDSILIGIVFPCTARPAPQDFHTSLLVSTTMASGSPARTNCPSLTRIL
jgi:hypothetical protein